MIDFPLPLLGFCAWSGTGKTTLLKTILPMLKDDGIRIAVVKHAHHRFDIDHPGKDSYELRKAGADQIVVASGKRLAFIKETSAAHDEPTLEHILNILSIDELDLVLVEGFKQEAFPKIELHRPSLGRPLFYPTDRHIIAIACDAPLDVRPCIPQLDLNQPREFITFIQQNFLQQPNLSSCL